jgi:hypothetical protein
MKTRIALVTLLTLVGATLLWAHDLFLKLDSYFLEPQAAVRIAVLNGTFTESEAPVAANRLQDISLVSPAGRSRIPASAWSTEEKRSWLSLQVGEPGTYVAGVSVRPNRIELTGSQFNSYLEEDGILDVLAARREAGELDRPARERYSKHVKAIFQVGDRRTGEFQAVLGYPAEIVPLTNPYSIRAGGELVVRCLVDGQPVAQQIVLWGGEGPNGPMAQQMVRTGADGTARLRLSAPGRWYVKFVHMERLSEPDFDYESKWATLTFEVR